MRFGMILPWRVGGSSHISNDRPEGLTMIATLAAVLCFGALPTGTNAAQAARPNVLFIAIDDMNDWAGFLGGHPQAQTPHPDRHAKSTTVFANAHAAAPWCNPSRTALLTGLLPSSTGVYHHQHVPWRNAPRLKSATTLPQLFRINGYSVVGTGKIFHHDNRAQDPDSWDDYWPSRTRCMERDAPPSGTRPFCGATLRDGEIDWAPLDRPREQMADWKSVNWAIQQLEKPHDKPFFIACGIFRPHLPWFAPRAYFDRFPVADIQLPQVRQDDLDDVSPAAREAIRQGGAFREIQEAGLWKEGVRAYLACMAFADDCAGHLLQALDRSPLRDNTIVVIWSDHGWHLGEKEQWEKVTLWERATKCVLVVRAPGHAAGRVAAPASLVDVYPTLVELCGLKEVPQLDGESLVPWLKDAARPRARPSLSTHGFKNHAIQTERYRFISYANGDEELYDHERDPHEWTNLAGALEHAAIKAQLRRQLPENNAPPLIDVSGVKTGRDALMYLIGTPQEVKPQE